MIRLTLGVRRHSKKRYIPSWFPLKEKHFWWQSHQEKGSTIFVSYLKEHVLPIVRQTLSSGEMLYTVPTAYQGALGEKVGQVVLHFPTWNEEIAAKKKRKI